MKTADVIAALGRRKPRFALAETRRWADAYDYEVGDQSIIDAIAPAVRRRGHFTRDEFLATYAWKTRRTLKHAEKHTDQAIADVTGVAFRQTDERLRIDVLCALAGVDYPVASVLLHVGLSSEYPIIDYRALWSLHAGQPSYYSFNVWWSYVKCCQAVAERAGVTVRELDQALWAYSDAKQPSGTR